MKRKLIGALLSLIGSSVFAQERSADYLSFLSEAERAKLVSSGELTAFGAAPNDLTVWKKAPFAESVRAALDGRVSTIAAESLFLIDLPAGDDPQNLDLRVLKAFTSFSTMKGLEVYSASQKKMETFIFDSSLIDSIENKKSMPDPVFQTVPKHANFLLYQKEEQTGDVYSSMSFDSRERYFEVKLNNLTDIKFLIFRLVAPQDLTTLFILVPTDDKLILYGITSVETIHFFGVERLKESSFYYRMKALAAWFTANLVSH